MFHFYVELASVHGIPADRLTQGLPSAPALLAHTQKWYAWDEHVALLERFEALMGGPAAADAAMAKGAFRRIVRPFNALVTFFTTAHGVYRVGFKWFAPAIFRHLRFQFESLAEDCVRGTVEIPERLQDSPRFLRLWGVSMRSAPLNIGLPESDVTVEYAPRHAVYTIRLPARHKVWARIRQWLRAAFRSADVVDEVTRHQAELKDAYESLLASHQANEAALRASEERQRALLSSLPDLVVLLRGDLTVAQVSGDRQHPLAARLLPQVGRPIEGTPEFMAPLRERMQAALESGEPQRFEYTCRQRKEPQSFEWRVTRADAGSVVCVVRDVSEKRQLERQLLLSDRLASLGTLAASVAHEINNPLSTVLASLEVARRTLAKNGSPNGVALVTGGPPPVRLISEAIESGERIRDIVAELRTLSRPDERQVVPVDVNHVVGSVLRVTQHSLRHHVRVETSLGPLPRVLAAEGRLGQVLVNLLINAAQAMPGQDVTRNVVRLETRAAAGEVVISVEDNGKGMAPEVLAHVFEPFFTTKPAGEGTGLGLAICQRIVTELGGRMEVDSAVDHGSTFRVILPATSRQLPEHTPRELRVAAAVASRPVAGATLGAAADAGAGVDAGRAPGARERRRILIIDDNPKVSSSLKLLLTEYEVTLANGGAEGLERLLREPYDVALCDLMMPEVDGVELFRRVRAERPGLERKIVFMTGGACTADSRTFLETVENPYLEKPFRAEQLEKVLRQVG